MVGRREIEDWLRGEVAARLAISLSTVSAEQSFESLGMDSAEGLRLASDLSDWLGRDLPETLIFDYPSIYQLVAHLIEEADDSVGRPSLSGQDLDQDPLPEQGAREPIAIVGIGCRFPGASGAEAFWDLLREGGDAITEIPGERWDWEEYYDPEPAVEGKMNSKFGGFIEEMDRFDARFFGISPFEAARMDPQQRLVLEVAWEAWEDAGMSRSAFEGSSTSVFIGVATGDYSYLQLQAGERGGPFSSTGSAMSVIANRVSYVFDLHGPSAALDTACSSSLSATHLACRSIWNGDAEMALAGGANIMLIPEVTVCMAQLGILAPDGRCKTFDARADGLVRSEAVGIVVLKPYRRARSEGDRIYGLIHETVVNNDGRTNGLTSPSRLAQEALLTNAYANSGVPPAEVQYVEAHGTGTMLGDPLEVEALGSVLGANRHGENKLTIGSAKTNLGHAEAAAGIVGLIKTALMIEREEIPPSLHFRTPNPHIRFDTLPIRVQTELGPWPEDHRVAGVSSFGFGGTNAHAVLTDPGYQRPKLN